jgi:hypothetical protein
VWKRQTVGDLGEKYKRGKNWIRKAIDKAKIKERDDTNIEPCVCVFDATHIGKDLLLAARAPEMKKNLGWAWIPSETKEAYAGLRIFVESKGYILQAVVLDGRTGIPKVFSDIPVQICQFHQWQIVKRKLTLHPETIAGVELLAIGGSLAHTKEKTLTKNLDEWFLVYGEFMNEKTFILGTKRWRYTHRRLRSAYLSLRKNLPFLFTYQKYPELKIPNTTNSLDGYWNRLKNLLSAHRGKASENKKKIANEILRKTTKTDCSKRH